MTKVLVTPRSLSKEYHASLQPLVDAGLEIITPSPGLTPSPEQLKASLPGCVGWLAGIEPVSEDIIDHGTDLKIISRNGSGVDNLPINYLRAKGIDLKTAAGSNARGVAELALALMLSVLRNIPQCDQGIRKGDWPRVRGRELSNLTIGVVGLGAIGRTACQLCLSLGSDVIAHDPFVTDLPQALTKVKLSDLDSLFSVADIVTFHCPAPADNKPLLGQAELATAKNGLIIINTARAGLIDNEAVLAGLNTGRIFGLATDVFESEPPELTPLLLHPRVVSTSHIGALTDESVQRSTDAAVSNILEALGHV